MTHLSENFEIRIKPSTGWWHIDWREIWRYRDLIHLLVMRDFSARYSQSVLGPVWFVLQPLLTTIIFTIVFGHIAQIPTGGTPPMLFYLCNQLGWGYFSSCFGNTSGTLLANQGLFSKVYFPRLVVPFAGLISNLIPVCIQLCSFLAFWTWLKFSSAGLPATFHFTSWLALLPLAFVQLALLALGLGLCMSAVTAKYRDLAQLSGVMIQLWMYATPVIYPLSQVPEQWRWLAECNPVSLSIEVLRLGLLGSGVVTPGLIVGSFVGTTAAIVMGLALFSKVKKTFIDFV